MSSFEYQCERCGRIHQMSASRAGADLECSCGFRTTLPPLSQLRRSAGLAAYEKTTAETIVEMVADGRLPDSSMCVACSARCDEMQLVAVCERMQTRTSITRAGGGFGGFVAGFVSGIPVFIPLGGGPMKLDVAEEQLGRDVVVPVPMRVCNRCWSEVQGHGMNALLRTGTVLLGIAAAVLFLLWLTEPILGVGVPLIWAMPCVGGAAVLWIARRWWSSRSKTAVKSLLQETPIYRDLCEDYPDLEVVAGRPEELIGPARQ